MNNIDNNTPIEFEIKGSKDEYIDTGKMFLHVTAQVVDEAGNNLTKTTICAPVINKYKLNITIHLLILLLIVTLTWHTKVLYLTTAPMLKSHIYNLLCGSKTLQDNLII